VRRFEADRQACHVKAGANVVDERLVVQGSGRPVASDHVDGVVRVVAEQYERVGDDQSRPATGSSTEGK